MSEKIKYLFGNWKLYKTPLQTEGFANELLQQFKPKDQLELAIFPQMVCLPAASQKLKDTKIFLGAQNAAAEIKGAFTGESSIEAYKELNVKYVLLGHSERRHLFFETDEIIAKKMQLTLENKLTPVFCIGEKLEERKSNQTFAVLEKQLTIGLNKIAMNDFFILAYEPVWAIGTGLVATPDQVLAVHLFLKEKLKKMGFQKNIPILYGGSVKPENIKNLSTLESVDGFLVGGASLEAQSFYTLYQLLSA